MVQHPVQGVDGGHRIPLPVEERTGFSDFKEILPETVTATSVRGMVLEVMARTEVFNAFKRRRAAIMKVTANGVEVA